MWLCTYIFTIVHHTWYPLFTHLGILLYICITYLLEFSMWEVFFPSICTYWHTCSYVKFYFIRFYNCCAMITSFKLYGVCSLIKWNTRLEHTAEITSLKLHGVCSLIKWSTRFERLLSNHSVQLEIVYVNVPAQSHKSISIGWEQAWRQADCFWTTHNKMT